jgi:hypothetical protein
LVLLRFDFLREETEKLTQKTSGDWDFWRSWEQIQLCSLSLLTRTCSLYGPSHFPQLLHLSSNVLVMLMSTRISSGISQKLWSFLYLLGWETVMCACCKHEKKWSGLLRASWVMVFTYFLFKSKASWPYPDYRRFWISKLHT